MMIIRLNKFFILLGCFTFSYASRKISDNQEIPNEMYEIVPILDEVAISSKEGEEGTTFLDELMKGMLWGEPVPNMVGVFSCLNEQCERGRNDIVTPCIEALSYAETLDGVPKGGAQWLEKYFGETKSVEYFTREMKAEITNSGMEVPRHEAAVMLENSEFKLRVVLIAGATEEEFVDILAGNLIRMCKTYAEDLFEDLNISKEDNQWRTLIVGHSLGTAIAERVAEKIAKENKDAPKPYVLSFSPVRGLAAEGSQDTETGEDHLGTKKSVLEAVGQNNLVAFRMEKDIFVSIGLNVVAAELPIFPDAETASIDIRVDGHDELSKMTKKHQYAEGSASERPFVALTEHHHDLSTYMTGLVLAKWKELKEETEEERTEYLKQSRDFFDKYACMAIDEVLPIIGSLRQDLSESDLKEYVKGFGVVLKEKIKKTKVEAEKYSVAVRKMIEGDNAWTWADKYISGSGWQE